jgi:hypothetical protein
MYDLGVLRYAPEKVGVQKFPEKDLKRYQRSLNLPRELRTGKPNAETWIALFGKDKP